MKCFCNREFKLFGCFSKHLAQKHPEINIFRFYKIYYPKHYLRYCQYYSQNNEKRQQFLKQNSNKSVKCLLCDKYFEQISEMHLRSKHKMTVKDYKQMYPEAKIISDNISQNLRLQKFGKPKHSKKNIKIEQINLDLDLDLDKNVLNNSVCFQLFFKYYQKKKVYIQNKKQKNKIRKIRTAPQWNKGLGLEDERIRRSRDKWVNTVYTKYSDQDRERVWGKRFIISKLETNFLNFVELELMKKCWQIHIIRQYFVLVDNERRLIDGCVKFLSDKIFIEIDGERWHNYPFGTVKDCFLDYYCDKNNIKLFRFWGNEIINNKQKCADKIVDFIDGILWYFEEKEHKDSGHDLREFLREDDICA